jgi:D-alanyl-lipoteichoic acid acyltransferase DltB (MBOAT superfamily)
MIFNSLTFFIFLLLVYSLYWQLNRRQQNILLLLASYIFYGWWDWRFLSLIFISSLIDYLAGLRLAQTEDPGRRRFWLGLSLATNLGLLGFFKYFNFFTQSFADMLALFGVQANYVTLNIILPVGISFYTFQTLSYTIDVYRRKCKPHRDALEFFAFVSFFPQLVAGPIERAKNMLGQFATDRHFDVVQAKDGLRQMLWGLFKKVVVADGLAGYVDNAFTHAGSTDGGTLALAAYFFAVQVYCDFSGYSDIATGCARLFGFKLMRNFYYPFFSRNVSEFWQRWHISLSSWFRDYLYFPLYGAALRRSKQVTLTMTIIITTITFTVSGLWHGASWTFIIWGFLNGIYYIPELVIRRLQGNRAKPLSQHASLQELGPMLLTFHAMVFAWILFRSATFESFISVLSGLFYNFDFYIFLRDASILKALILATLGVEWLHRQKPHPLTIAHYPTWVRWGTYNVILFAILLFGTFEYTPFIYFQF